MCSYWLSASESPLGAEHTDATSIEWERLAVGSFHSLWLLTQTRTTLTKWIKTHCITRLLLARVRTCGACSTSVCTYSCLLQFSVHVLLPAPVQCAHTHACSSSACTYSCLLQFSVHVLVPAPVQCARTGVCSNSVCTYSCLLQFSLHVLMSAPVQRARTLP
jgi:hypothetical protein